MTTGIWILGDQLHPQQAALATSPEQTPILMVESQGWVGQRRYHKQKVVLIWSAMRHFAAELQDLGYPVTYAEAETFRDPLKTWIRVHNLKTIYLVTPSDIPFQQIVNQLDSEIGCSVTQLESNHFLWTPAEFAAWAEGRKRLVMEDFYREGRQRYTILMAGDQPAGGQWNFDQENRKPPKSGITCPDLPGSIPDKVTQAVIDKVNRLYPHHFGTTDGFRWAVTRSEALRILDDFVQNRLAEFGPLQDAMLVGEDTLWHSLLSPYLNCGLLTPLEVIQAAEAAYYDHDLPIASVEGFIRQVLGWREYMRGLYYWLMPAGYAEKNWFDHHRPLPDFFWTGDTDMACLHHTLDQVQRTGYAHHIQRLMVLSNFALISGIHPQAVEAWFHDVFIDSYDWVMQTNVIGMGLFADGGILATKPYAASANYINKMSDYCRNCRYNHNHKTGDEACPFNFFYWDFLIRHRQPLTGLGRMGLVLSHLKRMDAETMSRIQHQAQQWWDSHSSPNFTESTL